MNPESALSAVKIASGIRKLTTKSKAEVVICPPMPYISLLSKLKVGAQDVSVEKKTGAYTGEVSATQLHSLKVAYAIVGHSERRARGETSDTICKKATALLSAKITPIICIGEKERHHDGAHWQVISHELHSTLSGIPRALAKSCIIAYEPIWAIGKKAKRAMTTEEISESAIFIKKILAEIFGSHSANKIRVIYGGSVDAKNAGAIAHARGISGFLVGRDSLIPSHFAKIVEAVK